MSDLTADTDQVVRAGLVGCGGIGSALDEGDPSLVLTHAGGLQANPRARLVAACDPDPQRLRRCGEARGLGPEALYPDFATMLARQQLDLLSVCTPVGLRLPVVQAAVQAGVRVILCEKPLAASADEARQLARVVRGSGSVVAVNYLRRWSPGVQQAAALVRRGALGRLQRGVAYYGKGVANNGSHMVDLISLLLGAPDRVRCLGGPERSGLPDDPSLDAELEFGDGQDAARVALLCTEHQHYTVFELDLLGSRGRLRVTDLGQRLELFRVRPDPVFAGYQTLALDQTLQGGLDRLLERVVGEAVDLALGLAMQPRCGLAHGLAALELVELIKVARGCAPDWLEYGPRPELGDKSGAE